MKTIKVNPEEEIFKFLSEMEGCKNEIELNMAIIRLNVIALIQKNKKLTQRIKDLESKIKKKE
jgi:hypothetical protein